MKFWKFYGKQICESCYSEKGIGKYIYQLKKQFGNIDVTKRNELGNIDITKKIKEVKKKMIPKTQLQTKINKIPHKCPDCKHTLYINHSLSTKDYIVYECPLPSAGLKYKGCGYKIKVQRQ